MLSNAETNGAYPPVHPTVNQPVNKTVNQPVNLFSPPDRQARWLAGLLGLVMVLGLAVALAGLLRARGQKPAVSAKPAAAVQMTKVAPGATPVEAVRLQRTAGLIGLGANGSVAARQESVIAAEVQGLRLKRVAVKVGDGVKAGDVLAEFDTATLLAELARTQAQLEEARAANDQAQQNQNQAARLQDTGVLSGQQQLSYSTDARSAQARQQALEAAVRLQRLQVQRATVRAVEDGVVIGRQAVLGAVVASGQELFRLMRQGQLEWRAEVPATELARVRSGQVVKLVTTQGSGAAEVRGTVREIAPTVDPVTRNGTVHVNLPANRGLRPGMFLRGDIQTAAPSGWAVPFQALVLRDGQAQVFVVDKVARARLTPVTLGRRLGDTIEVQTAIAADAWIVSRGAALLTDGELVQRVSAASALQ